ncbi:hypothetical protein [Streptomyces nigrescens]|uniref:DUF11 domain-containing protein n=1 Tax=Streptomyces nigrescens TaxID=1920 RepID=A0ABY7IXK2_STRNI|nr:MULTISPECIES: hypothetical protein [Streptomyces]MCX5451405.1 hypothetical protein [Streptomyces libani]WAU02171.1 DUF11 domain-containing protein [Streptomyces nigrescens]
MAAEYGDHDDCHNTVAPLAITSLAEGAPVRVREVFSGTGGVEGETVTLSARPDASDTYTSYGSSKVQPGGGWAITPDADYPTGALWFQVASDDDYTNQHHPVVASALSVTDVRVWPQVIPQSGSDVFFAWKLRNDGPSDATQLQVTVTLPSEVTVPEKYHPNHSQVQMGLADLPVGHEQWFRIPGHVDAPSHNGVAERAEFTAFAGQTAPNVAMIPVASDHHKGKSCGWLSDIFSFIGDAFAAFAGLFAFAGLPFGGGGGGGGGQPDPDEPDREEPDDDDRKKGLTILKVISQEAKPDPAVPGQDQVSFIWTVKNTGKEGEDAHARFVIASLQLPEGCGFVSGPEGAVATDGGQVLCLLTEDLAPQATAALRLTVSVPASAERSLTAWAYLSALNAWPCSKSVAVTAVPKGSWGLPDGSASPNPVDRGKQVTYTWQLASSGPSDAHATAVTVSMPAHLDQISASAALDGHTYPGTPKGQHIDIAIPSVPAGHTATITASGTVGDGADDPLTATVTAEATSTPRAQAKATARMKSQLRPTVAVIPAQPRAGQLATYVWTLHNDGPPATANAKLTVTIPPAEVMSVLDHTGATQQGDKLVWTWGSIAPGHAVQARLGVLLGPAIRQMPAIAATAQADNVPAREADAPSVGSPSPSALSVAGTAGDIPVLPGQHATFTWTITNTGRVTATEVTAQLALPEDLTDITITPSPSHGTTVVLEGPLAPGKFATVTATGTVPVGAAGSLGATATVSATDTPAVVCADAVTVVGSDAQLGLAATSPTSQVPAGSQVELTWTVTKTGPSPITQPILTLDAGHHLSELEATVDSEPVPTSINEDGLWEVDLTDTPAPSQPVVVAVTATVAPDIPDQTVVTVPARVDTVEQHTETDAKTHMKFTTCLAAALTVTPIGHDHQVTAGNPANPLEWTVVNKGPSQDDTIALAVTLPKGFTVTHASVSTIPSAVTQADTTWTVPLGHLEVGEEAPVALVIDAPDAPLQPITVAWKASGAKTTTPAGDSEQVKVAQSPALTANSLAVEPSVRAGDGLSLGWTLASDGTSTAHVTQLTVILTPPDGFTPEYATAGATKLHVKKVGDTVTVTGIGDIPPATDTTIILSGTIPAATPAGRLTAKTTVELTEPKSTPVPDITVQITT